MSYRAHRVKTPTKTIMSVATADSNTENLAYTRRLKAKKSLGAIGSIRRVRFDFWVVY